MFSHVVYSEEGVGAPYVFTLHPIPLRLLFPVPMGVQYIGYSWI